MGSEERLEALEMQMFHFVRVLRHRFRQDLGRYDLTFPQFMTLLSLERAKESCRMGPLATATFQSAASLTSIVDRLLERGLVERQRDPRDRRSVVVSLTEAGRQLIRQVKADRRHAVKQALAHLPPEEQSRLLEILDKMVRFLEAAGDAGEVPPQRPEEL